MKNITLTLAFIFASALNGLSQTADSLTAPKRQWKAFTELDLGLLAMSGGIGSNSGIRKGPQFLGRLPAVQKQWFARRYS